jgi:hypothetical protein
MVHSAVCKTTCLSHFPGWGRGWRRVVTDWYLKKEPMELSECVTKFRGQYGWKHRDIIRLAHPKSSDAGNDGLLCKIWDSYSAVSDDAGIWGCDTVSSGLVVPGILKDCITFIFLDSWIFKGEGTIVFWNVRNHLPSNPASHCGMWYKNCCFLRVGLVSFVFIYLSNLGPNRH